MLIVTHKPENLWLIGLADYYAYAVGIAAKNEYIIYRKCIFDSGEWDIFYKTGYCKLKKHHQFCDNNIPMAAGIINNKLWVLLFGSNSNSRNKSRRYHVCSIDLSTSKMEIYKILNSHDFMYPLNFQFCIKCFNLQITPITDQDNSTKEQTRFMVAPNRIYLCIRGHVPFNWTNFFFDINEIQKTCKFGNFNETFIETKSILTMYLWDENNSSNNNGMPYISVKSGEESYAQFDAIDAEGMCLSSEYQAFFRNQNGQVFYLIKKMVEADDERDTLVLIKPNFNYEQKIVRYENINQFSTKIDVPHPFDSSIFIDDKIIVFQHESTLVTAINRALTLSEIAYLTLLKIPPPVNEKSFKSKLKNLLKKKRDLEYNSKIHGFWMSQKCLHKFFGVPLNVKINHG